MSDNIDTDNTKPTIDNIISDNTNIDNKNTE